MHPASTTIREMPMVLVRGGSAAGTRDPHAYFRPPPRSYALLHTAFVLRNRGVLMIIALGRDPAGEGGLRRCSSANQKIANMKLNRSVFACGRSSLRDQRLNLHFKESPLTTLDSVNCNPSIALEIKPST